MMEFRKGKKVWLEFEALQDTDLNNVYKLMKEYEGKIKKLY